MLVRGVVYAVLIVLGIAFTGCEGGKMSGASTPVASKTGPSESALKTLSGKRIFFAHQSVGFNIVDGLNDLMKEDPRLRLEIVETSDPKNLKGPVFAHSRVGKNLDPALKIRDFEKMVEGGIGGNVDFAILKLCYVDVDRNTDVRSLFELYRSTVNELAARYPATTFIHVTAPLTTQETSFKTTIKKITGLGTLWEYADNIKRNEFNELLLAEYGARGTVYDLARVESTDPAGSAVGFTVRGKSFRSMVPGYASDSGHLNQAGRKAAAREMVSLLANLAESVPGK